MGLLLAKCSVVVSMLYTTHILLALTAHTTTDIARHNLVCLGSRGGRERGELYYNIVRFPSLFIISTIIITRARGVCIYITGAVWNRFDEYTRRRVPVTIFVRKFRGLGHAVGSRFHPL